MKSLIDIQNNSVVIIGAGATVKRNKDKILEFIKRTNALTIGINYMTSVMYPDFHLWTNKKRYHDFGSCINSNKSTLLFGNNVPKKLIMEHHNGTYITITYVDERGCELGFRDNVIYGDFRTAGVLAIMLSHVYGAKTINVVGMDGFTLHSRKELLKEKKSHHCYGRGYTDDASWERCKYKDFLVNNALHKLKEYGVEFSILTPTKFKDFYHPEYLI